MVRRKGLPDGEKNQTLLIKLLRGRFLYLNTHTTGQYVREEKNYKNDLTLKKRREEIGHLTILAQSE
jgi:hypothetical protein